jgi:hypothetical protein
VSTLQLLPEKLHPLFCAPVHLTGFVEPNDDSLELELQSGNMSSEKIEKLTSSKIRGPENDAETKDQFDNFLRLIGYYFTTSSAQFISGSVWLQHMKEKPQLYHNLFRMDKLVGTKILQQVGVQYGLLWEQLLTKDSFADIDFSVIDFSHHIRMIDQGQFHVHLFPPIGYALQPLLKKLFLASINVPSESSGGKGGGGGSAGGGNGGGGRGSGTGHQGGGHGNGDEDPDDKRVKNESFDQELALSAEQFKKLMSNRDNLETQTPRWNPNNKKPVMCLSWHYRGYCNRGKKKCPSKATHKTPNTTQKEALKAFRKEFLEKFGGGSQV